MRSSTACEANCTRIEVRWRAREGERSVALENAVLIAELLPASVGTTNACFLSVIPAEAGTHPERVRVYGEGDKNVGQCVDVWVKSTTRH